MGSLRAKNLALLGKWWWRFKNEPNSLWARVISSIYGSDGGLGYNESIQNNVGKGPWVGIIKSGWEINNVGIEFRSSFCKKTGDGDQTRFWEDDWVGSGKLKNIFSRLYNLEVCKNATVRDRSSWVNGEWVGEWRWSREIRGRANDDIVNITSFIRQNVVAPSISCRDKWW